MTIYKLKMTEFIDILFSEVKPDWWEDLYSEYLSARSNSNSVYVLGLMKEIAYLSNKYFLTLRILEAMCIPGVHSEGMVKELRQMGFKGTFNPADRVQYESDLRAAMSASKRTVSQIQRKQEELAEYQKKFGGNEVKRQDFEDMAVIYSKFMGYYIDFEKVSVAQFCSIATKYEAHCEVQNAQANNLIKENGYGR